MVSRSAAEVGCQFLSDQIGVPNRRHARINAVRVGPESPCPRTFKIGPRLLCALGEVGGYFVQISIQCLSDVVAIRFCELLLFVNVLSITNSTVTVAVLIRLCDLSHFVTVCLSLVPPTVVTKSNKHCITQTTDFGSSCISAMNEAMGEAGDSKSEKLVRLTHSAKF